ncbi:hypothetical protein HETIRDRAFT_117829, partial [Heterobasidion irregulare TC 32-1]
SPVWFLKHVVVGRDTTFSLPTASPTQPTEHSVDTSSSTPALEVVLVLCSALRATSSVSAACIQASLSDTVREPSTKRHKGTGKVAKEEDFWSKIDQWFVSKVQLWGNNYKDPRWGKYITETVQLNLCIFQEGPGTLMQHLPNRLRLFHVKEHSRGVAGPSRGVTPHAVAASPGVGPLSSDTQYQYFWTANVDCLVTWGVLSACQPWAFARSAGSVKDGLYHLTFCFTGVAMHGVGSDCDLGGGPGFIACRSYENIYRRRPCAIGGDYEF